jgi:protein gp37
MGEKTGINYVHHTWNSWQGCNKISPGCAHCYMFTAQYRMGMDPETVVRCKTWGDPLRWQKRAAAAGITERVLTCSWSDFFHPAADEWRPDAWKVIRDCPNLTFLILTKRPEFISPLSHGRYPVMGMEDLPPDWGRGYPNVWLGVSVETPRFLFRMDILRTIPARVRFISAEPLLAPLSKVNLDRFDWVIVGGESGRGFRPMDHAWAREIREQCHAAGKAFFFKQSAALRPGMGTLLDGKEYKEYPTQAGQEAIR